MVAHLGFILSKTSSISFFTSLCLVTARLIQSWSLDPVSPLPPEKLCRHLITLAWPTSCQVIKQNLNNINQWYGLKIYRLCVNKIWSLRTTDIKDARHLFFFFLQGILSKFTLGKITKHPTFHLALPNVKLDLHFQLHV